jgi:hypothetical protein
MWFHKATFPFSLFDFVQHIKISDGSYQYLYDYGKQYTPSIVWNQAVFQITTMQCLSTRKTPFALSLQHLRELATCG